MGIAKHGMGGNGMGMKQSHGPPQAWARGGDTCTSWKCYKVFCTLVVRVKRSVDQSLMRYFDNFVGFWAKPPEARSPTDCTRWPLGDFCPRTPKFAHLWEKSRGRPWTCV